jgi:hypothetical protein
LSLRRASTERNRKNYNKTTTIKTVFEFEFRLELEHGELIAAKSNSKKDKDVGGREDGSWIFESRRVR